MQGLETAGCESAAPTLLTAGEAPLQKSESAFRTISEVSVELDIPQHVLRFWETKFAQIQPVKRNGGRRYYRPDDINLIRKIKHLLYQQGYTIRGVQRVLRRPRHAADESPLPLMEAAGVHHVEDTPPHDQDEAAADHSHATPSLPSPERLMAAAMTRLQPLAHVMAVRGVYPSVGTVPVAGIVLPPKPAALKAAAEKAAAAAGYNIEAGRAAAMTPPAGIKPRFDAIARQKLEAILVELRGMKLEIDALKA